MSRNRSTVRRSLRREDWGTPQWLFDRLAARAGGFTLDAAASHENAKCPHYYTEAEDGLAQPWHGRVFVNPPYGRGVGAWIQKAADEYFKGNAEAVTLLLPASTDTSWFHTWCVLGTVWLLPGRLVFEGAPGPAPFASMVVEFRADLPDAIFAGYPRPLVGGDV